MVRAETNKEVCLGRVLGHLHLPVPNLRVLPPGMVSKKAPGEFRLIHHWSYLQVETINDGIPQELCTVMYISFDSALCMVQSCRVGAELVKCDVKPAFCLLPVHPNDFELVGFAFEGSFFMVKALLISCSVSCTALECFSSFLE